MGKHFSAADVEAHQLRHHGAVKCTCGAQAAREAFEDLSGLERHESHADTCPLSVIAALPGGSIAIATPEKPKKPRMNKTETDFAQILEAKKRRGDTDTLDYAFQPLALHWGLDEKTGIYMRYRCDFLARTFGPSPNRVIEVKGGKIWDRDLVRFRGCRAEWQWLFDFELHQKKAGEWKRIE